MTTTKKLEFEQLVKLFNKSLERRYRTYVMLSIIVTRQVRLQSTLGDQQKKFVITVICYNRKHFCTKLSFEAKDVAILFSFRNFVVIIIVNTKFHYLS